MLKRGMTTRQARGPRFRRVTLYLTPRASERLDEAAAHASERAGVLVTPEAAARGLVYSGLGLSVDGNGASSTPETELVAAVRAFAEAVKKAGTASAPEVRPVMLAMGEALGKVDRSLGR